MINLPNSSALINDAVIEKHDSEIIDSLPRQEDENKNSNQ